MISSNEASIELRVGEKHETAWVTLSVYITFLLRFIIHHLAKLSPCKMFIKYTNKSLGVNGALSDEMFGKGLNETFESIHE